MNCPNCSGKRIYGFRPLIHGIGEVYGINVELPCPICKGTGELPSYIKYDRELGQKIKELRIENQLTLRHFSHITGIDATILSEQEKGLFRRMEMMPLKIESQGKEDCQDGKCNL